MKKAISLILVFLLTVTVSLANAENNVEAYRQKFGLATHWTRVDYNIVYTKAAQKVLPALLSYSGKEFSSSSCRVFGDETGEVWLISGQEVYRMWWSEEGYLVLTSTSDGLGYTGYGVFKPGY